MQIYGKESQFDAARLVDLLGAYESFKVASTSARGSMSNMDTLEAGSPTALPAGTAPGRYEPQGSAWPRVQTAAVPFHKLGQSAMLVAPLEWAIIHISYWPEHSAPCASISCHAKSQDGVGLSCAWCIGSMLTASLHGCIGSAQWPHPTACTG